MTLPGRNKNKTKERGMRHILALICCAALIVAAIAGCGGRKTYTAPGGEVAVEERGEGAEVTITAEDEEGTVSVEVNRGVTEEEIGLPFYPGSEQEQAATFSQEGAEAAETTHVTFTTPDSIDQVKAFYEDQVPDVKTVTDASSPDSRIVQMIVNEGEAQKMIIITRDNDAEATTIILQAMRPPE
jgi:hypothetical protein